MTTQDTLDKIDLDMAAYIATIEAEQEKYFALYGIYFQGLITHSSLPDGTLTQADKLTTKPSDQRHDWHDFMGDKVEASTVAAVECHNAGNDQGQG
ncbi:MAG: hypothetical protein ACXABY_17365, partial [Candidatus Thorarchaeota archaeon]